MQKFTFCLKQNLVKILHFAQLKILLKLKILFWAKSDAKANNFQSHFATPVKQSHHRLVVSKQSLLWPGYFIGVKNE